MTRALLAALLTWGLLASCQSSTTQQALTTSTATIALGSCHARTEGGQILPDQRCTPGAPEVCPHGPTPTCATQANIRSTICTHGWTSTIRPPVAYTDALKRQLIVAYGYADTRMSDYELDHSTPLETAGDPRSPANLWPQPIASARVKDKVENAANHAICSGRMTLATAQQQMAADWVKLGQALGVLH